MKAKIINNQLTLASDWTKINNQWVSNPTDEQLSSDGYKEFIIPQITQDQRYGVPVESNDTITLSVITLTAEELAAIEAEKLMTAKETKIAQIVAYDSSSAVNEFTLNGVPMWLSQDQRIALQQQINSRTRGGDTTMMKIFDGQVFEFPLSTWQSKLDAIEIYAGDALNVTEQHKLNVNAMESSSDVESYDYTARYPDKLVL